jgi:carbon monoxide dehydrogenase subunit G
MKVGGVIAGVGQRMIEAAAKMLAHQFFTSLEKEIPRGEAEPVDL